jgi:hypothetical protein
MEAAPEFGAAVLAMPDWEYITLNLSDLPFKIGPLDLLNDAGRDGWELVAIASNNVAYLKRKLLERAPRQAQTSARAKT